MLWKSAPLMLIAWLSASALDPARAESDPTEPAKVCYLQAAQFYARQVCDPAPFLTGAVFGACASAEAEAKRKLIADPHFQNLTQDFIDGLAETLHRVWTPRVEARIVDTRIKEGLCK